MTPAFRERVRAAVAGENWRSMCARYTRRPGRRGRAVDRCKRLAEPQRLACAQHLRASRASNERGRIEAQLAGFCSRCLKHPPRPGRKTCALCAGRHR